MNQLPQRWSCMKVEVWRILILVQRYFVNNWNFQTGNLTQHILLAESVQNNLRYKRK